MYGTRQYYPMERRYVREAYEPTHHSSGSLKIVVALITGLAGIIGAVAPLIGSSDKVQHVEVRQVVVHDPCTGAAAHWHSAEDIHTIPAYRDHQSRFKKCDYTSLAQMRIEELQQATDQHPDLNLQQSQSPPPPTARSAEAGSGACSTDTPRRRKLIASIETEFARDEEYAKLARDLLQCGDFEKAISTAEKVSNTITRETAYTTIILSAVAKRDYQTAIQILPKFEVQSSQESACEKVVTTAVSDKHYDDADRAIGQLKENTYKKESLSRLLIEAERQEQFKSPHSSLPRSGRTLTTFEKLFNEDQGSESEVVRLSATKSQQAKVEAATKRAFEAPTEDKRWTTWDGAVAAPAPKDKPVRQKLACGRHYIPVDWTMDCTVGNRDNAAADFRIVDGYTDKYGNRLPRGVRVE
jgi:tetratricopeptide (TPR) repeat protein